MISIKRTKIF